jgi:hypothetical protein
MIESQGTGSMDSQETVRPAGNDSNRRVERFCDITLRSHCLRLDSYLGAGSMKYGPWHCLRVYVAFARIFPNRD